MSLSPSQLSSLMVGQCSSKGIKGQDIPKFCQALSEGLITSFKQTNSVTSIDVGIAAVGSGTGKIIGIVPSGLTGITLPFMLGNGLKGIKSIDWVEAICTAIVMHFLASSESKTSHIGVAVGTGIGQIIGLSPGAMTSIIVGKMASKNIKGPMIQPLVDAVSKGFCTYFQASAKLTIVITGAPVLILAIPIPSAGSGTGKVS